jgi:hypothetical protein
MLVVRDWNYIHEIVIFLKLIRILGACSKVTHFSISYVRGGGGEMRYGATYNPGTNVHMYDLCRVRLVCVDIPVVRYDRILEWAAIC